jgi:hypothetical protein
VTEPAIRDQVFSHPTVIQCAIRGEELLYCIAHDVFWTVERSKVTGGYGPDKKLQECGKDFLSTARSFYRRKRLMPHEDSWIHMLDLEGRRLRGVLDLLNDDDYQLWRHHWRF